MRSILIGLAAAAMVCAADGGGWIGHAGGVVTRNGAAQIVSVDLRSSWVSDADLAQLAKLPALSRIDLSETRITDHGLQELKGAPAIADLNLRYAEFITDEGLMAVRGWKHLKRLNVRGTKITDTTLQHLAGRAYS